MKKIRQIGQNFFEAVLRVLAIWALKKFKPKVVAITGTVGKTTTKDVVVAALKTQFNVRGTIRSQNSDLTTPLSIFGRTEHSKQRNPLVWVAHALACLKVVLFSKEFPEILVLEVGTAAPGDITRQAQWLKPDVSVFTALSNIPVHVEFFSSKGELFNEKKQLAVYTKENGSVIYLNDETLLQKLLSDVPRSKVEVSPNIEAQLPGVIGEPYSRSLALALAVVKILGGTERLATENINQYFLPEPGRMRKLEGIKGITIIDDSYNASPLSVKAALQELKGVQTGGRKIFLFGDMKELGEYTEKAHIQAGEEVWDASVNLLVTVGEESKKTAEVFTSKGGERTRHFATSDEAGLWLKSEIKEGDFLLAKSSRHALKMEQALRYLVKKEELKNLVQEYL